MLSESVGRGSPFILAIWSDGPSCDLCGAAALGADGARAVSWALAGALAVVGAVVAVAARKAGEPSVAHGA